MTQVSIIMATYNRAHLIGETLDSILNLEFPDWECIIINDGGTDDTDEVVTSYVKTDSRFSYHYRPMSYGKGLPGCRNYGLDIAQGAYIVFVDDDDVVHPKLINHTLHILHHYPQATFCHYPKATFTHAEQIRFSDMPVTVEQFITAEDIEAVVTNKLLLASCTLMWRKSAIADNRFIEHLQFAEEWEFYTRLILEGCEGVMIQNTLYYNRKHPESNTGKYWMDVPEKVISKLDALMYNAKHLHIHHKLSDTLIDYFIGIWVSHKARYEISRFCNTIDASLTKRMAILFTYYKVLLYRSIKNKSLS